MMFVTHFHPKTFFAMYSTVPKVNVLFLFYLFFLVFYLVNLSTNINYMVDNDAMCYSTLGLPNCFICYRLDL